MEGMDNLVGCLGALKALPETLRILVQLLTFLLYFSSTNIHPKRSVA